MKANENSNEIRIYEIRFRGLIDQRHTRWFDGFEFIPLDSQNETIIKGRVLDQSALFGVISRLRDLNLELLDVHYITEEKKE